MTPGSPQLIRRNLAEVHAAVQRAAAAAGRDPASVRLLAVSKTVGVAGIQEAYDAGQRCFGENRVQELAEKAPQLPSAIEWHLIGHLHRNKVRPAVAVAAWVHSVDSVALLERIDRIAAEEGAQPIVLLEINLSGEEAKHGIKRAEAPRLLEAALQTECVDCRGLMTMAPYGAPETVLRHVFSGLRELRDQLATEFGVPLPELSMGMSDDFPTAIAEGATIVRIGSAIFGQRGA